MKDFETPLIYKKGATNDGICDGALSYYCAIPFNPGQWRYTLSSVLIVFKTLSPYSFPVTQKWSCIHNYSLPDCMINTHVAIDYQIPISLGMSSATRIVVLCRTKVHASHKKQEQHYIFSLCKSNRYDILSAGINIRFNCYFL